MIKAHITVNADKSDPLNEIVILDVRDGDKKYTYQHGPSTKGWEQDVGAVVGDALDDLIYHDGKKGRVHG